MISLIQSFPIALAKMLKIELAITIFLALGSAFQSVWSILGIIYFSELARTNDNYFWYSGLITVITTFSIGVPIYLLAIALATLGVAKLFLCVKSLCVGNSGGDRPEVVILHPGDQSPAKEQILRKVRALSSMAKLGLNESELELLDSIRFVLEENS